MTSENPAHGGRPQNSGTAPGTVYLVGAGPGAADLLTLRAARLLAQADIVFHDALVGADILALAERAKKVAVGKRCGRYSTAQQFINRQLVRAATEHRVVVRLKGGDPMLFGRAQEELDELHRHGIPTEVVPGISAAFAASAQLQQSLTQRGVSRSVTFVTPRIGPGEESSQWARAAVAADTVALYMGGKELASIAGLLIDRGMPESRPVSVVAGASLPGSLSLDSSIGRLAAGDACADFGGAPVLLLIGEVFRQQAAEEAERVAA